MIDAASLVVPSWLQRLAAAGPSDATAPAQLCVGGGRAGECSMCFDPLWRAGAAYLLAPGGAGRVCGHYFCAGCCAALLRVPRARCPLCRADAAGATCVRLPDPREGNDSKDGGGAAAWFVAVDAAGKGRLSKTEVALGLEATLPLSKERLLRAMEEDAGGLWRQWCGGVTSAPAVAHHEANEAMADFARALARSWGSGSPSPAVIIGQAIASASTEHRGALAASLSTQCGGPFRCALVAAAVRERPTQQEAESVAMALAPHVADPESFEAVVLNCPPLKGSSRRQDIMAELPAGGAAEEPMITPEAFVERGGLLQWVYEHLRELETAPDGAAADFRSDEAATLAAELRSDPRAWFLRFDIAKSGGLSEDDVIRAMMRTFEVSSLDRNAALWVREQISLSWKAWDEQANGQVSLEEFLAPGGLAEDLAGLLADVIPAGSSRRDFEEAVLKREVSAGLPARAPAQPAPVSGWASWPRLVGVVAAWAAGGRQDVSTFFGAGPAQTEIPAGSLSSPTPDCESCEP